MPDTLTPPRLPDSVTIPEQAVREWLALPASHELDFAMTKQQIDHLFFAINKIILSQDWLQACIIHTSNGRMDEGNKALVESQRETVEAQNRLRQFMTDVMLSSTRKKS